MFLTSHVMIGYILFKVLNLDANLWIFLVCSILPDASWPFYKQHRKQSWYHTVLTFGWSIFFHPYWIAILSHFIVDAFFGGIRLTPWDKKVIGIKSKEQPSKFSKNTIIRLFNHLREKYFTKWYNILLEVLLFIICVLLFFYY